jgi:hypothetical protein
MGPTIWGLPAQAVSNQLQNFAMLALMFFGTRAHMSSDMMGQYASLIGIVTGLVANHLTVTPRPDSPDTSLPNGPIRTGASLGA